MSLVDFVVEEQDRLLLLEIKDPSQSNTPSESEREFIRRMESRELIDNNLVPKARDSYTYLHLMKRDCKELMFVLLLGLELDRYLRVRFKDRLLGRMRHEAHEPWVRRYVEDCVIVTPESWAQYFPSYRLSRSSWP